MDQNFQSILIIRFSSLGDIVQAMGVLAPLKKAFPELDIDWATKAEFAPLLQDREEINQVFALQKVHGAFGDFLRLGWKLRKKRYCLIYDAHSNLRSLFLWWVLRPFSTSRWVRRSKERWRRFLLFQLGINRFPAPFKGSLSYFRAAQKDMATHGCTQLWPLACIIFAASLGRALGGKTRTGSGAGSGGGLAFKALAFATL